MAQVSLANDFKLILFMHRLNGWMYMNVLVMYIIIFFFYLWLYGFLAKSQLGLVLTSFAYLK